MSDLGANDRFVVFVSGDCAAGCGGFWASFGVSGGCFAGAGGSGLGAGCATVDVFRGGGPVFFFAGLIFFVTILGLRGSFDAWSQPSITVTKPIKQAKLQIRIRFFFMAFHYFSARVSITFGVIIFVFSSFAYSSVFAEAAPQTYRSPLCRMCSGPMYPLRVSSKYF